MGWGNWLQVLFDSYNQVGPSLKEWYLRSEDIVI